MVKQFRIVFDTPSTDGTEVSVVSGHIVSGAVIVEVEEPKKYKCIKIFLKGKGHVLWIACIPYGRYEDKEKYVDLVKELWDKSRSPGNVLPAGEHRFPFQFTLPLISPSSYEGPARAMEADEIRRWIRYDIEAVIFAGSFRLVSKHNLKIPLKVTQAVNVNTPQLDRPFRMENQASCLCLSCVSGQVSTTVEVPRTGYTVGEDIPFRATVENGSSRRVNCIAQLREQMIFTAQGLLAKHHRHDHTVFHATLESRPIESRTTTTWIPEETTLRVPVSTPVSISTKIIKRCFYLDVVISISPTKKLIVTIPITIGNVQTQPVTSPVCAQSLTPPEANAPELFDMPPSYEQAVSKA